MLCQATVTSQNNLSKLHACSKSCEFCFIACIISNEDKPILVSHHYFKVHRIRSSEYSTCPLSTLVIKAIHRIIFTERNLCYEMVPPREEASAWTVQTKREQWVEVERRSSRRSRWRSNVEVDKTALPIKCFFFVFFLFFSTRFICRLSRTWQLWLIQLIKHEESLHILTSWFLILKEPSTALTHIWAYLKRSIVWK